MCAPCMLCASSAVQVICGELPPVRARTHVSEKASSNVQVYISQASLGADITTAKSSEVNVLVPGSTPDADLVEHAIPEQYVSEYKNGKYVTLPVSHSGG